MSAYAPGRKVLKLRSDRGITLILYPSDDFEQQAMKWAYVVGNRRGWADSRSSRDAYAAQAGAFLQSLGLSEQEFKRLAQAHVVEVAIPYESERESWPQRIMPWEFLISHAVKPYRTEGPFVVTRHLQWARKALDHFPQSLLFIESAPGPLGSLQSFSSENRLVENHLGLEREMTRLVNPRLSEIKSAVLDRHPDVIHLTGIHSYQGGELVSWGKRYPNSEQQDGIWLTGEDGGAAPASWRELSKVLCPDRKSRARLFVCNTHHSAARICSMAVAEGVAAAIGFQDEFDDAMAELFFTAFYSNWRQLGWNLLGAFCSAMETLRGEMRAFKGTGIVLWSDTSLVGELAERTGARRRRARAASEQAPGASFAELEAARQQSIPIADTSLKELVVIKPPRPVSELNYSLLHNDRDLFEEFSLALTETGTLKDVRVGVSLHLGSEKASWSQLLDVQSPGRSLKELVRVPLVSPVVRALRERVHTSLTVEVWVGSERLYLESFRVALLPVDEWRDDDANRKWLPSFVRPNDPAVRRVVDLAQKYLCALSDSSDAGFDGYQSVDCQSEDPCGSVDRQVQAIWWALAQDISLRYINPPPTFTHASQRLRTPGDVVSGGRGTCIDLALLLASCLEYVEIYPVIFLLRGHAFPGYCRDEDSHDRLREAFRSGPEPLGSGGPMPWVTDRRTLATDPWVLPAGGYDKVLQLAQEGHLIPLETVWLTSRRGFWDSMDEGMQNLRSRSQFEALFDIRESRRTVTPLPIESHGVER